MIRLAARTAILLSAAGVASVALQAIFDPQKVMDLVAVQLANTDAISSIRGVYGGVGVLIALFLVYLAWQPALPGTGWVALFWGSYALSRLVTLVVDGALGSFGNTWLVVETVMCVLCACLWMIEQKVKRQRASV